MAVAAGISSCASNEDSFNKGRAEARSRPDLVADFMRRCTQRVKYTDSETKRNVAGFMHISLDDLPEKFCGRILRGYASGRMKYADLKAFATGQKITPAMVAILRAG
jgi:hypothetical protein